MTTNSISLLVPLSALAFAACVSEDAGDDDLDEVDPSFESAPPDVPEQVTAWSTNLETLKRYCIQRGPFHGNTANVCITIYRSIVNEEPYYWARAAVDAGPGYQSDVKVRVAAERLYYKGGYATAPGRGPGQGLIDYDSTTTTHTIIQYPSFGCFTNPNDGKSVNAYAKMDYYIGWAGTITHGGLMLNLYNGC